MRRWFLLALAAILSIGVVACGDDEPAAQSDAAPALPAAIRVASDIPYAPFEFFEGPGSREAVGFDVDIVNAIAGKVGIAEVEFVDQAFDSIFISIPQGRFDMAASSITITPERAQNAIFSAPYFEADQSIMVKKGSDIAAEADLAGKTLGVQRGTTGAEYATKIDGADIKRYEEIDDAFIALETGRVDAVINDFAISAYATKERTELEVVSEITTDESYGLMFPKESTDLRDAFDRGLQEIRDDGTYAELYRKWFNQEPPS